MAKTKLTQEAANAAWHEVENSKSDRVTVIMAGSYLEYYLRRRVRMHMHYSPEIKDNFYEQGALASFDANIKIGRLTGLYGDKLYKDLKAIKDIRNAFAHRMEIVSFDDPDISKLVDQLTMGQDVLEVVSRSKGTTPTRRERFVNSVGAATLFIGDRQVCMMPEPPENS